MIGNLFCGSRADENNMGKQQPEVQFLATLQIRLENLALAYKSRFSAKIITKNNELKLSFPDEVSPEQQREEIISINQLRYFLIDSHYEFLLHLEGGNVEASWLILQRLKLLIIYTTKQFPGQDWQKEELISLLNEAGFLQSQGILGDLTQRLLHIIKKAKTIIPRLPRSRTTALKSGELSKILHQTLFSLKIRLRCFLALTLLASERSHHDKAIGYAHKSLLASQEIIRVSTAASITEGFNCSNLLSVLPILYCATESLEQVIHMTESEEPINQLIEWLKNKCDNIPELDLSYLFKTNQQDLSSLNSCTILSFTRLPMLSMNLQENEASLALELSPVSILEKIGFVTVALYVLATEHRFRNQTIQSPSPFSKALPEYLSTGQDVIDSERYLSKATELAYLFLPDRFPFVAQIFAVFRKFELNRPKVIPELDEAKEQGHFLIPLKNGIRSQMIIPLITNSTSLPSSLSSPKIIPETIIKKEPKEVKMLVSGDRLPFSKGAHSPALESNKQSRVTVQVRNKPSEAKLLISARPGSSKERSDVSQQEVCNKRIVKSRGKNINEKLQQIENRGRRVTSSDLKKKIQSSAHRFPSSTSLNELPFAQTQGDFRKRESKSRSKAESNPKVQKTNTFVNRPKVKATSTRVSMANAENNTKSNNRFNISFGTVKNVNFFITPPTDSNEKIDSDIKGAAFRVNQPKRTQKVALHNFIEGKNKSIKENKKKNISLKQLN